MPKIRYKKTNFRQDTLDIIRKANAICQEYAARGFDLTLRQLYYQFVARDWMANKQSNYNRLGNIINDARYAGLIDWEHIVDRTRNLRDLPHWKDAPDFLRNVVPQFRHDKWADQPNRVEVWIEKDALVGVLEAACRPEDVPFFSCRGYTSASEVWGAAQRLRGHITGGQRVTVLHLGDHDPSGVDMTRDVDERLWFFIASDLLRTDVASNAREAMDIASGALEIRRIALNMDQVDQYNPPPNPAKFTDSRFAKYVEEYGRECWELDALPPDVLVNLIRDNIRNLREPDLWLEALAQEDADRRYLQKTSDRWEEVVEFLRGDGAEAK